jgi:hypothetical protein
MLLQSQKIEIFADYHQFYLWDREMTSTAPEDYTDEDVARRIKTGPHVVVIQPERDMTVPVEIEIHDAEPECRSEGWDHIAEASLYLPTGHLQVHECTGGPVADLKVAPGWYRVRSLHGGLGTLDESGLDGGDYYKVALWLAAPAEVTVVKQWAPAAAA